MKLVYETPQMDEFKVAPMSSLLNDTSPTPGGGEGGSGDDY